MTRSGAKIFSDGGTGAEIWFPVPQKQFVGQASCTNNAMFYSVFWTKLFWTRSQKLQVVGGGAKKFWCPETESEIWEPAPMSLVRRGLTGVIIALWRTLLRYSKMEKLSCEILICNCNRTITISARMKANENFSDASVERFFSVRINRVMSPSDAVDLGRPVTAHLNFMWFTDTFS